MDGMQGPCAGLSMGVILADRSWPGLPSTQFGRTRAWDPLDLPDGPDAHGHFVRCGRGHWEWGQ